MQPAEEIQSPPEPAPISETAPETAPAEPAAPTREDTVRQVVESEFATYDADQSGELDQDEFGRWVSTLRQQSLESQGRPPVPENEMKDWAKNAFAKADADKSEKVSKAELQSFLMG